MGKTSCRRLAQGSPKNRRLSKRILSNINILFTIFNKQFIDIRYIIGVILKRLLAMVETVRAGDPFVAANASRLQVIAWTLLALQVLSLVIGAIGKSVSTPAHPLHLNAGFSVNGWLAVLLMFLLARVFAEGALMREDLEGTV